MWLKNRLLSFLTGNDRRHRGLGMWQAMRQGIWCLANGVHARQSLTVGLLGTQCKRYRTNLTVALRRIGSVNHPTRARYLYPLKLWKNPFFIFKKSAALADFSFQRRERLRSISDLPLTCGFLSIKCPHDVCFPRDFPLTRPNCSRSAVSLRCGRCNTTSIACRLWLGHAA